MLGIPDPNEGSTDPMEPEYWHLGEALQERIQKAGHESETVDGIAVDLHDLLQAARRIELSLAPVLIACEDNSALLGPLERLRQEFEHIRWHCDSAVAALDRAADAVRQS